MAGIQVMRLETRRTLDRALVIHDSGASRPETARDVRDGTPAVVQLGGVGYDVARQAIEEHWPRGRGRKPHEAVEVLLAGAPPYGEGEWSLEREREFAEACYAWTRKTLGPQSVIVGAWWHRDESSPHVHVIAVPIASTAKMGWKGVRTEAMARLGKRPHKVADTFRALQDDFHEVAKGFGLLRGEVGSQATHQQVNRAQAAERRADVAEQRTAVAVEEAAEARAVVARRDELHAEAAELHGRRLTAQAETIRAEREAAQARRERDELRGAIAAVRDSGWMGRVARERRLRGGERAIAAREGTVALGEEQVRRAERGSRPA